jgi:hypothetical protein
MASRPNAILNLIGIKSENRCASRNGRRRLGSIDVWGNMEQHGASNNLEVMAFDGNQLAQGKGMTSKGRN